MVAADRLEQGAPRTASRAPLGTRWRALERRERVLYAALTAAVMVPFIVAAIAAWRDGWYPSGDDGFILTGTRRVFSPQIPLVGELTSSEKFGVDSYHPAPIAFYLQAPLVTLFGVRLGPLLSSALAGAASMAGIGYVTLRTAGFRRALWAWSVVLLMGISIGGSAYLYRPFKTVVAILPLMLFLFASWALASGKLSLAPIWVVAGCYPAGSSAQYVTFVVAMAAITVLIVVVRRWRDAAPPSAPTSRHPTRGWTRHWPRDWSRAAVWGRVRSLTRVLPSSRRGWTIVGVSVSLGLVTWAPPLFEAATNGGGNLRQLYRASKAATDETVGVLHALTDGARALVFNPAITRAEQATSARLEAIGAVVLLGVAVALVVIAWPRLRVTDRLLVALAAASLLATTYAVSSLPGNEGYAFYRLLSTSVATAFAWFAAGSVAAALAGRWRHRRLRPEWSIGVGSVVVVLLCAGVAWPLPLQNSEDYLQWTMRAVPELVPQVAAGLHDKDGVWIQRPSGPRSTKVILFGLAAALEDRGFHTDQRRPPGLFADPERPIAGQLLVIPSFAFPPSDEWQLVGHYEPEDRDVAAADAAAAEIAAYARESGADLNDLTLAALPFLYCPDLTFAGGECPAAEEVLAEDRPIEHIPDWLVAISYVETFDEQFPFEVIDATVPPDDLLQRVRDGWVDIPVDVYARPAS